MTGDPPRPGRADLTPWAAAGLVVLTVAQVLAAVTFLMLTPVSTGGEAGPATGAPASPAAGRAAEPVLAVPAANTPAAVRATELDIPKLGLHQELLELAADATGRLQPPSSPDVPGWFTGAAAPGETGPTVIAGHVDSGTGPGVFYRLKDLAPGDLVEVGRSDGRTVAYRVTGVQTVSQDAFPARQVYGPTAGAELRLITCGGTLDRVAGHYLRNVVVSGVLADAG